MLRSSFLGFGFVAAAGCASLAGCTDDSPGGKGAESDAAAEASGSGGKAAGSGGAVGTGGKAATGGAGTGGAGTGGAGTGGSDASTADGSTGGTTSDASTADGSSAGGMAGDASTADGSSAGGMAGDASTADGSSAGGAASDATPGAGGAASDASSVLTCGSAPYARLWVGGGVLLDHPTGPISVSGSACPGTTFSLTPNTPSSHPGETGIDAQYFDVPDQTPIHLRATQTGSFPLLTQEVLLDRSSILAQAFGFAGTASAFMVATDSGFDLLDPSWNAATRALLLLQVAPLQGATGNCADGTGITVTVDGHAEATGASGATPIVTAAGTNGTLIFLTTTGTASAAELLTLTVAKTGCTVKTTAYDASPGLQTTNTGKFPVEAGAVTWGLAAITN